jgi:hypothetical protein
VVAKEDAGMLGSDAHGALVLTNARPWTSPEDPLAELERVHALLEALPPHPVCIECGAEVLDELRRRYTSSEPPPELVRLPGLRIEIVDDLPAWTIRVRMSDGSSREERLR